MLISFGGQQAKSSAQLQPSSQALFVDVRTLLQKRSRVLSVGIRAVLIILSLLIIGGGVVIYYAKVLRPAQLSVQATAAVRYATATAQALLTATVTSEQHLLTTSTSGSAVLNDRLSDNSGHNGWEESTNCAFTGGSYHVTNAKPGYIYYCTASLTIFADFAYQVQLSINSGDEGCLILRYSRRSNTVSFDAFCVSSYGYYYFFTKPASAKGVSTLESGLTAATKYGTIATNTVTVIARRSQYTIYINNRYVLMVSDTTTSRGNIGVGKATDVAFNNARVWTLS